MTRKDIAKLFKRFFITFFCCVPVLLLIGFLLQDKIQDWILTVVFIVIAGGVFAIEEYIHFKLLKKREALKQQLKQNKNAGTSEKSKNNKRKIKKF